MFVTRMNGGRRRIAVVALTMLALLMLTNAAAAVTGEVYTGNISARRAASHLLGAAPRDPEVVASRTTWTGSALVIRVHVNRINPYLRSSRWQVTQILGVDLTVHGRTRMTDTDTSSPGGPEGYSCGAGGTHVIGSGSSHSYATDTYLMRIPRSAFLRCGIRAGRLIRVVETSMMQTDNAPSASSLWLFGAWAAQWSSEYSFRL